MTSQMTGAGVRSEWAGWRESWEQAEHWGCQGSGLHAMGALTVHVAWKE